MLLSGEREGKKRKKGARESGLSLQKRDLEMLLFLNEMGWGSVRFLSLKFFSESRIVDETSKIKITRRRLGLLEDAGFLRSFRIGKSEGHYLTTPKGVETLKSHFPEMLHLSPVRFISLAENEHSQKVILSRIALEKAQVSYGWRSERRLKFAEIPLQKEALKHRSNVRPYLPDGVFLNENKEKVLFEYEHAAKSQAQMSAKIEKIEGLLSFFPARYQRVLVVSTTTLQAEKYKKMLSSKTKYQVLRLSEILKQGGINGYS